MDTFQRALARRLNIKPEEVDPIIRGEIRAGSGLDEEGVRLAVRQAASELATGVFQAVQFFQSTSAGMRLGKVLISGGGSYVKGLDQAITKKLRVPVAPFDAFENFPCDATKLPHGVPTEKRQTLAVALGLGLRTF